MKIAHRLMWDLISHFNYRCFRAVLQHTLEIVISFTKSSICSLYQVSYKLVKHLGTVLLSSYEIVVYSFACNRGDDDTFTNLIIFPKTLITVAMIKLEFF